jgi:hypothetical protein
LSEIGRRGKLTRYITILKLHDNIVHELNVLLTVHRKISVLLEQQHALFVFSLLRINSLCMFQALLAQHQEVMHVQ